MNRRSWLKTAAGLLVAPAVVRAESLMRVRPVVPPELPAWVGGLVGMEPGSALFMSAQIKRAGSDKWEAVTQRIRVAPDGFARLRVPPDSSVRQVYCGIDVGAAPAAVDYLAARVRS